MFINNNWGGIPLSILSIKNTKDILDDINEYCFEESKVYCKYQPDKKGSFILDMYSYWRNNKNKSTIIHELATDLLDRKNLSDVNLVVNKGFFIYEALEGNKDGNDYPIDYEERSKMGDYFRHLLPTIYGYAEDLPIKLRKGIAFSPTLDFTTDRFLDNDLINDYFPTTL